MIGVPIPLLAFPHLSTSAKVLAPEDRLTQARIALDSYEYLMDIPDDPKWLAALMWLGYEGALLYWVGELCRGLPQDGREWLRQVEAWCGAYRAGAMAVGPLPWWLGDTGFHLRCQSQLMQARPAYGAHFVHAPLDLAYWWPQEENTWKITEL